MTMHAAVIDTLVLNRQTRHRRRRLVIAILSALVIAAFTLTLMLGNPLRRPVR